MWSERIKKSRGMDSDRNMADPLEKYRKSPAPGLGRGGAAVSSAPLAAAPRAAAEPYAAYAAKDKAERIQLRPALGPQRAPSYVHLLDIASDGPYGTNFSVVFTFMTVLVRGRNLQAVVAALESVNATFLQQFHPELWPRPAEGDAVIDVLEIYANDPAVAAMEKKLAAEAKAGA